jgi:hypothetical protein
MVDAKGWWVIEDELLKADMSSFCRLATLQKQIREKQTIENFRNLLDGLAGRSPRDGI